jgi:hypothetical protein
LIAAARLETSTALARYSSGIEVGAESAAAS